jgi:hypothetical protein
MIIKVCQECGVEFQARSGANKNCSTVCGNISANRLKAARYLAKSGRVKSKGAILNDARQSIENRVPGIPLARQLWNKKINLEVTA